MDRVRRNQAALLGALVGDAASLGAHWIYDVARIDHLRAGHGDSAAFLPVKAAHYEGGVGYFAHGARRSGMPTQYGAVLTLAMAAIIRDGRFEIERYQEDFAGFFGPGGGYVGYIDRPTRGALANLAAEKTAPSGIDDDQLPAMATLPAVIVATAGNPDAVNDAMSVTNDNDVARAYGAVFLAALTDVLNGTPLREGLEKAASGAEEAHGKALLDALRADEPNSTVYGDVTGRACHLPMAMPLAFHIMARAESYRDAIERNIDAGGDSAGRAIVIGALMGAARGICTDTGVPLDWIARLEDAAATWASCIALALQAPKSAGSNG